MEQYYYNHMNKQEQAAYHGILQGLSGLADEFQIPALDGILFLFRNICLIKAK